MSRPSGPLNLFIQVYKCRVSRYTNIHRCTSWITASYMSVPVTSLRLYTGAHAFLYLSQPVQFRSLQDQGLDSLSFQFGLLQWTCQRLSLVPRWRKSASILRRVTSLWITRLMERFPFWCETNRSSKATGFLAIDR